MNDIMDIFKRYFPMNEKDLFNGLDTELLEESRKIRASFSKLQAFIRSFHDTLEDFSQALSKTEDEIHDLLDKRIMKSGGVQ